MSYQTYKSYSTKKTSQSEPIPGKKQVKNNAGGYTFEVGKWDMLNRFLILGTEGGTYYVGESKLTKQNADSVAKCIQEDGKRVVDTIVEISDQGRAFKNDPALFALAMCAGLGDDETRKYALESLPKVARIGTHLFNFATFVEQFRGWGRGLRNAIAHWYVSKSVKDLSFQVVKYQSRNGWSNRDLLRKVHASSDNKGTNDVFSWVTHGVGGSILKNGEETKTFPYTKDDLSGLPIIWAFESAKNADEDELIKLIKEYRLTMEMIPTNMHTEKVLGTILPNLGLTAIIRNLGKFTAKEILKPMNAHTKFVVERLTNPVALKKARIHPLAVLNAIGIYKQGRGLRGSLTWTPVQRILDALDDAFYLSFGNIEPTGKRTMLALDVSGSMGMHKCSGLQTVTAREASAAMAMVTARTESDYFFFGFASDNSRGNGWGWSRSASMLPLNISPKMRLDTVVKEISGIPFGGTDCSLPMKYALQNNMMIDTFVIYTDNETWAGDIHASQMLEQYRREMNPEAKMVVVSMVSNHVTIADPNDAGQLDVVGFDTNTPNVISEFSKGNI